MIENATGLVVRTRPLTETSLIVHWLTPDLGRLATVAKGARRPQSPFRGKLDLFYLADFSFSRSRRSELHTLREVRLQETHAALRQDLERLRQAARAVGLLERHTETETPLPEFYALMRAFLRQLIAQPPSAQTLLAFELKLLAELGLTPDLSQTRLHPGTQHLASALLTTDWSQLPCLKPSTSQIAEITRYLEHLL
jgi:DNA repair protein RecO (recombination protein O)